MAAAFSADAAHAAARGQAYAQLLACLERELRAHFAGMDTAMMEAS